MKILRYKLHYFTKKIIFLFFLCIIGISVSAFYLYTWLFPSLDNQLFTAASEKCGIESICKVHLHDITAFKWDKVYFFPSERNYSNQDIKKITGISFDLQKYKAINDQEYKTLAMFVYHDKLVKYNFFDIPFETDDHRKDDKLKSQYFDILFLVDLDLDIFKSKYDFGKLIEFKKNFQIAYYEITPINDLLYINFYSQGDYYNGYSTQALALCSNLNQVHLYNPQKD